MSSPLTSDTFLPWLTQEAFKLAQATAISGDPFPGLWGVAVDALDWLRSAPPETREKAGQTVKQCLDTGAAVGITIAQDRHEANCLVTLLQWIVDPLQVLWRVV